ncbi:hypothetical protein [Nocardia sp. alder85J]|uniref:hypothetical protein n=1 Tax=Nocardia sp. alder85J TaxID=2862949 RepID=UPI001CD3A083|nr:hypothetical protein [Nocardia sp. alder85J]MCX4093098.1 hypothetical protein [Nocardia sp. alder85J]
MRKPIEPVTAHPSSEILDFFGKCPECGYPARASTTPSSPGTVAASCDRPCGWTGTVPLTTMTRHTRGRV